jgi:hypothetical protein
MARVRRRHRQQTLLDAPGSVEPHASVDEVAEKRHQDDETD